MKVQNIKRISQLIQSHSVHIVLIVLQHKAEYLVVLSELCPEADALELFGVGVDAFDSHHDGEEVGVEQKYILPLRLISLFLEFLLYKAITRH